MILELFLSSLYVVCCTINDWKIFSQILKHPPTIGYVLCNLFICHMALKS